MISSLVNILSVPQRRKKRTWWSSPPTGPFLALKLIMGTTKLCCTSSQLQKGWTDIVDQCMGFFTSKVDSQKWWYWHTSLTWHVWITIRILWNKIHLYLKCLLYLALLALLSSNITNQVKPMRQGKNCIDSRCDGYPSTKCHKFK